MGMDAEFFVYLKLMESDQIKFDALARCLCL